MSNDIKLNVVLEDFEFEDEIDIHNTTRCLTSSCHTLVTKDMANFDWKLLSNSFGDADGRIHLNVSPMMMVGDEIPVSWKIVCLFQLKDYYNLIHELEVTRTSKTNAFPWFEHDFQYDAASERIFLCGQISMEYETHSVASLSLQKLSENCSSLLESGAFSDMIVCANEDGTEFQVHRAILSSRSDVFSAMLSNKMKESLTGRVVIEDTASSTIKEMLDFIYSGKVNFENIDSTCDLLEASDKYNLTPLKLLCAEYLLTVMDENNACKILLYAHNCKVEELKSAVLKYMCENKTKFSDQKMFEILKRKNPDLLCEIILELNKV